MRTRTLRFLHLTSFERVLDSPLARENSGSWINALRVRLGYSMRLQRSEHHDKIAKFFSSLSRIYTSHLNTQK